MEHLKVLRLDGVEDLTGLRRSQLYQLTKEGRFPKPLKLLGRSSGWLFSEVQTWIAQRIAERDEKESAKSEAKEK